MSMKLKPEQLEAARQKQVGNILQKLASGGVLTKAEMRVLQGATDPAPSAPAAPAEEPQVVEQVVGPLANARHEAFARIMAAGRPAAEAYVAAGYKPDRGHACRLAAKPEVVERVQALRDQLRRVNSPVRPPTLPGSNVARARLDGAAGDAARVARTMESMSLSMSMVLDERFSDEDVAGHIEALLHADRSFQQDGALITVPDYVARARGVELLMKYKLGLPYNRAEPRASKSVDLSGFAEKLKKSPAFRAGLKEMIAEAEADEKKEQAVKPEPEPAALPPAT